MTETPIKKVEISEKELLDLKAQAEGAKMFQLAKEKAEEALAELRKKKVQTKKPTQPPPASTEQKETSTPPLLPDPHADHGHEKGKPHYIGAWQRFCPSCGDQNPDFKDETICNPDEGGCGAHLGSVEVATKLKACPNCGGHRAKKL